MGDEYEAKPKMPVPVPGTAPAPKPKPKAEPKSDAQSARLAPFPTRLDLPEQLINSSRVFPLVRPKMSKEDVHAVKATVSIEPVVAQVSRGPADELMDRGREKQKAEAFSPLDHEHILDNATPIPIRFWPKSVGDHEADIRVLLRWGEDGMELRTIRVYGHARTLEDAPANPIGSSDHTEYRDDRPPVANLEKVPQLQQERLTRAKEYALIEARGVAAKQNVGRNTAEHNSRAYTMATDSTVLDFLIELAITSAVGSIASVVARAAANWLGPKLAKINAIKKRFDENDPIDKKKLERFTEDPVADAVKDGLKNAVRAPLVQAAVGGKKPPSPDGGEGSSNGRIEFFRRQESALAALETENATFVLNQYGRLQHKLLTHPEEAIAAMESIEAGLKNHRQDAENIQQRESELQWVALIGRLHHGEDTVSVNGRKRKTTDMKGLSHTSRGVLRIGVVGGVPTSATILGVSQEIADRLRTLDLRNQPIPIVIVKDPHRPNPLAITRDEVGRVRISQIIQREIETDHHHEAQELADHVLSKSLSEWGVKKVDTDDGTGRGG
jgi:hypothetical protein